MAHPLFSQREHFTFWGALSVFCFLALFPLFYMFGLSTYQLLQQWLSSSSPFHLEDYGWGTRQFTLFQRSLWLSIQATAIAGFIGLWGAWFLAKYSFRGKFLLAAAFTAPAFIPPYLHAMLWNFLLGRKGIWNEWLESYQCSPWIVVGPETHGAAWILGVSLYPYVFWLSFQALRQLDGHLEDSFLAHFGPKRILFSFYLPMISPALSTSLLLVFILASGNFGVPQVLLVQVYPLEIFTQYSAFLNYPAATFVSLPLIGVSFLALILLIRFERTGEILGKQASPSKMYPKKKGFYLGLFGVFVLLSLTLLLPLFFLSTLLQGGRFLKEATENGGKELLTSFYMACGSAGFITILAFWIGKGLSQQAPSMKKNMLRLLVLSPLAFPGILLATGMTKIWVRFDIIYLSLAMLIFACTARFSSFGIHILERVFSKLPKNARSAAFLFGGPALERKFSLQFLANDICSIWILSYALSFGEVDASILVKNPTFIPIGPTIISLLHFGHPTIIATLSFLAIILGMVPVFLYFLVTEKLLDLY